MGGRERARARQSSRARARKFIRNDTRRTGVTLLIMHTRTCVVFSLLNARHPAIWQVRIIAGRQELAEEALVPSDNGADMTNKAQSSFFSKTPWGSKALASEQLVSPRTSSPTISGATQNEKRSTIWNAGSAGQSRARVLFTLPALSVCQSIRIHWQPTDCWGQSSCARAC